MATRPSNKYVDDLEATVASLRQEVDALRHQRQTITQEQREKACCRHNEQRKPATIANMKAYVAWFRFGRWIPSSSPPPANEPCNCETHRAFLKSFMHENVKFGAFSGIDKIIEQWQTYTATFDRLEMLPLNFSVLVQADVMVGKADVKLHVGISWTTLHTVFPHVLPHQQLVDRLLGRRVAVDIDMTFEFDQSGFVTNHQWVVDFFSAIKALLSSWIEGTIFVLEHALIDLFGHIPTTTIRASWWCAARKPPPAPPPPFSSSIAPPPLARAATLPRLDVVLNRLKRNLSQ